MVNEFKLTVVHCMRVDLTLDKKTGKSGLGRRAAGPSRAVGRGPMGLRAPGPLGSRGPWAAGRWATGLLLAKPVPSVCLFHCVIATEFDYRIQYNRELYCMQLIV